MFCQCALQFKQTLRTAGELDEAARWGDWADEAAWGDWPVCETNLCGHGLSFGFLSVAFSTLEHNASLRTSLNFLS